MSSELSLVPPINTRHLQLLPVTCAMARAALESPASVPGLLGASVVEAWPGPDVRDILPRYTDLLERDPSLLGWGIWLMLRAEDPTLVGDIGFKGKPDSDGAIEIGYSVLPRYRRQGFASEAASALIAWGLRQPGVTRVRAECDRHNRASIGVLTKVGLRVIGEEDGLLLWETVPNRSRQAG